MLRLITTFEAGVNYPALDVVYLGPWCIENGLMDLFLLSSSY